MGKKLISLYNPSAEEPDGRIHPPLGLCYLAAMVDKDKYDVKGHNYLGYKWIEAEPKIRKELETEKPDIIGIQCLTYNRTACFELCKLARVILPDSKIILGGVHATILKEEILKRYNNWVDFIVYGEGEYTFPELLENFDHPEKVKGIAYTLPLTGDLARISGFVNIEREIKVTEPRELIQDLDSLPFPDLSIFDEDYKKTMTAKLYSSRGCLFRCNFCSSAFFWKNCWRGRSSKNVVDEMEQTNKRYPGILIDFSDEYFTKDWKRVDDICKEILKRKLKLRWICETRITGATLNKLKLMKQAGCESISMGVESGSPKIIKTIGKGITNDSVVQAFKLAYEAGLRTGLLLMVGQPGETQETINESKELVKRLFKYTQLQEVAPLWVFPGTPIYEDMKKKGQIDDNWWFENEGIPYYTVEHSYKKLREWASEIVWYNHRLKGLKFLIPYAIKGFFKNPMKFINLFIKRRYWGVLWRR